MVIGPDGKPHKGSLRSGALGGTAMHDAPGSGKVALNPVEEMFGEAPEHCMDCPAHRVVEDPDLDDSFNHDDMAIVCTCAANPNRNPIGNWVANRGEHRIISGSVRPYNLKKEDERPDWCPRLALAARQPPVGPPMAQEEGWPAAEATPATAIRVSATPANALAQSVRALRENGREAMAEELLRQAMAQPEQVLHLCAKYVRLQRGGAGGQP